MDVELPSGTVSLLFSDIEGSTALLSRAGESYAEVLDAQRRILREAWTTYGGNELGTEGDSFYVVFATARSAVLAAAAGQRALAAHEWPGGAVVRVRMGIHSGDPARHADAYVGLDVHRAARVAAAAHGGQVVLTDVTRQLLGPLPDGLGTTDLGWHRFRDLAAPEHLHQLTGPGLDEAFPPLKSLGAVSRLPAETTPLVGRDRELADLLDLVSSGRARLVTLTGLGGAGKTRLATALAASLGDTFPGGVYFVPCAAVTDPARIWTAIAEALGLGGDVAGRDSVLDHLGDQRLVLVLDNLEHLPTADAVVADLLDSVRGLVVVVTSRRPLHLRGESVRSVEPLPGPEAVELFLQQARLVRPDLVLDQRYVDDVVELCRRLDGLPLAVELAAARTRLLSPGALLVQLRSSTALGDNAADRPARHRTIRDTIAWSHDLLEPHLQRVFRRLAVFVEGAGFDGVQAVAADGQDPFDAVAELADAALVVLGEDSDRQPRVVLLATVRDVALELLADSGEEDDVRRAHAAYCAELVARLTARLHTAGDVDARCQLRTDYPNIREALAWTLRPGAAVPPPPDLAALGVHLAAMLRELWRLPDPEPDPDEWLRRAVELAGDEDSPDLAAVLGALGMGVDEGMVTRALEMSRRLGDDRRTAEALHLLERFHTDDHERCRALLDESIALARRADDRLRLSWVLGRRADLHVRAGEPEQALDRLAEVVTLTRQRGDQRTELEARLDMVEPLLELGRVGEARTLLRELVELARQVGEEILTADLLDGYARLLAALAIDDVAALVLGAHTAAVARLYDVRDADDELARWLAHSPMTAGRDRLGGMWDLYVRAGRSESVDAALEIAMRATSG
ncbi:putative ATPase/class 3 adenylate cyclase [Nocardioides ginsengisegetis]|uniref:Putative ATPase/class 3 adenylate cyclase n=1 Tax=Nocardioides ginsengisegetis TaxID=661491 RepID=A0A7W3J1G5_9ACTN|nr:tetratricopeptide repeat protein [Nocardioides ginsengisegetis]MBA8804511.1 putative ATPase/class 3 adenylate cyclase [Nocardioides ginsengisegetis]